EASDTCAGRRCIPAGTDYNRAPAPVAQLDRASVYTYNNYSEDGKTFLNGTAVVDQRQPNLADVAYTADLTMTGENTGSIKADYDYTSAGYVSPPGSTQQPSSPGHITTTYDGAATTSTKSSEQ